MSMLQCCLLNVYQELKEERDRERDEKDLELVISKNTVFTGHISHLPKRCILLIKNLAGNRLKRV